MTAILTLALGIGATTSTFSVVNAVLLRPLPYRDPGQLVTIYSTFPHWRDQPVLGAGWDMMRTPHPDYVRLRQTQRSFSDVAAYDIGSLAVAIGDESNLLPVGRGSPSLLRVLGVATAHGRWFLPEEEGVATPMVAVLSDKLWRNRLASDPNVLGGTVRINEKPFTIVGILPPGFAFRRVQPGNTDPKADLWIPLGADGASLLPTTYDFELIGRLRDGSSPSLALTEVGPILRGSMSPERRGARIVSRTEVEVGALRKPLLILGAAVVVLLLITCTNVASLMLGECATRESELRTRAALGASRARLVRLLLTESAIIAFAGAAIGTVIAMTSIKALLAFSPLELPQSSSLQLDTRVLLFSMFVAALSALTFGLAPALLFARSGSAAPASRTVARGRSRLQSSVIGLQAGLSMVLLSGAGLLARSLYNEVSVDPGFHTDRMLTLRVYLPRMHVADDRTRRRVYDAIATGLTAIPGVESVTASSGPPLSGRTNNIAIVSDLAAALGTSSPTAERDIVFDNYFSVLRIPMVSGRSFGPQDADTAAPRVAIVNEAMGRRFWRNEIAIGRRFRHPGGTVTIVGIVGDVRNKSLRQVPEAKFYLPFSQEGARLSFVIKTRADPANLTTEARRAVWSAVPGATIAEVATMDQLLDQATAAQRYRAMIAMVFAGMALVITAVGVAGLAARSVAARLRELCIRIAVGATPMRAMLLAVRQSVVALGLGASCGALLSLLTSRWLAEYLYDVRPSDPVTYAFVLVLITGAAALALIVASRRLRTTDVASELRSD